MKTALPPLLFCLLALTGQSQETDAIPLQLRNTDVREVLALYERLTKEPIFVALDLHALVTIQTAEPVPREAAIELIRTTLLARYGIELRSTGHHETLAAWSKDPKFSRRSDDPPADARRRVRIINATDARTPPSGPLPSAASPKSSEDK